jgi:3-oxoacyl-[acyl-carrier protein] reductase
MANARHGRAESRVAIVTGGSRGVGRETIDRLVSLGYAVVVNYVHDQRTAESTVEAVLAARGTAVAIRADVADDLDVERLFDQTVETFGAVDAVVHAVRGHVTPASLTELALEEFDALCRTNLRATFIVNQLAARHVRNGGAIVNLSGSVGAAAFPSYGAHVATTAAIDALTRTLALDLRQRDITVNAVSVEIGEPCSPRRLADVIAYLLSSDGHGITGHALRLDHSPQHLEGATVH